MFSLRRQRIARPRRLRARAVLTVLGGSLYLKDLAQPTSKGGPSMTHRHSWIPMVAALAVFVLAAFALTASTGAPLTAPGAPAVSASGPFAACDGAALAAP